MNKEEVKKIFSNIFENGIVSFWREISSTQKFAENFPLNFPLLVIAEKQTNSYGRRGSKWYSPEGGLWFTVSFDGKNLKFNDKLSVKVGEIVKKVLEEITKLKFSVKEPNDILYNDKKICGILITKNVYGDRERINIGVGINVNNEPPIEEAESLKNLTGKEFELDLILRKILTGIKNELC